MAVEVRVLKETAPGERRVAATPETVKKLVAAGARVVVERGAGAAAGFIDQAYADAGAAVDGGEGRAQADVLLCVQPPPSDAIAGFKAGATLVGMLQPTADPVRADALQARGAEALAIAPDQVHSFVLQDAAHWQALGKEINIQPV